jgi:hypothetical protein
MKLTEYLSKDILYSKISQEQIFQFYCSNFKKVGTKFKSDLRKDPNPSCAITSYHGVLWYKDFGTTTKAVDAVGYVMLKYGLDQQQAIELIAKDFNIQSSTIVGKIQHVDSIIKEIPTKYEFKVRNYQPRDFEYWGQYYFEEADLKFFDIYPIQWLRIIKPDKVVVVREEFMYVYIIGNGVYKFLSPYSEYKWLSNCTSEHFQGYNQLPKVNNELLITKSMKDVVLLYKTGYHSVAPSSESILIGRQFITALKKRFDRIVLFYDNDAPGIAGANKNAIAYKLESIMIPQELGIKDISDYAKINGLEGAKNLMKELLYATT